MNTRRWNGDSIGSLAAIGLCASLMASVLLLAPAIAGQLIVKLGFSEPEAGYTISAELAGISVASFPAWLWLKRANWRTMVTLSLVGVAIGNVVSVFCISFETLAVARFLTALCAGNVMLVTMYAAAAASNPEKSYSVWLVGQLILGAIGLALLPSFFLSFSLREFYGILALLALALIALVPNLPQRMEPSSAHDQLPGNGPIWFGVIGLAGLVLYYLAIGGTWTFAEQIGVGLGAERQQIGFVLSLATVAGIAGALMPPMLNAFVSRVRGVVIGTGLLTISIFALSLNSGWLEYAVAAVVFKFAWTFTVPFILAVLASLDRNGVIIAASNVLIGLGLALGPFVAAGFIAGRDDYTLMLMAMGMGAFLSVFLLFFASTASNKGPESQST